MPPGPKTKSSSSTSSSSPLSAPSPSPASSRIGFARTNTYWWRQRKEEEEEGEKNYSTPTREQCHIFDKALKTAPGVRGALPQEVVDLWYSIKNGPGAAKERHAIRNAIVPRDAAYGTIVTIDPNGRQMEKIRTAFQIRQKRFQMKGMTESEMLYGSFQGNKAAMKEAIAKNHILVKENEQGLTMYYWSREHHEVITGGKESFTHGKGEKHNMTEAEFDKFVGVLEFAPWATWSTTPASSPQERKALKNVASQDSDAMTKAQECMDASQSVCVQMKDFYTKTKSEGILTMKDAGSIPTIMQLAMSKMKEMENEHMQAIAKLIWYPDGQQQTHSVQDIKQMLGAAAKTLGQLKTHMNEAKALVAKFKIAQKKKEEE